MSDVYSDDYASVADPDRDRLVPQFLQRLAAAGLFVVLVGAMALWAYRLGTRDASEVPIIRAMEGPSRLQPENPGGVQAAHQGLEVNSVLAGDPAPAPVTVARVTPPPTALADEDRAQGELVLAAPAAIDEAALAAGDDLRMPQQDDPLAVIADPAGDAEAAAVLAAVLGETPPAGAAPEAADPAAATDAGPRPLRRPANLVVARAPAPAVATARPATPPAAPAPAPAAARGQAPAASAPAAPTAAPVQAREVRSVPAGARMVQLGAYDNEALTRQAWERLVARNADLLGSKSLYVERTTANARVFYRLRVAGFDSTEQTRVMCEQLRARGVDCIPVTLQ